MPVSIPNSVAKPSESAGSPPETPEVFQFPFDTPGIFLILEGYPALIIRYAGESLLGTREMKRNVLGQPVTDAAPGILNKELQEIIRWVFETGKGYAGPGKKIARVQDGITAETYCQTVCQPLLDEHRKVSAVVLSLHDITEQVRDKKRIELALLESETRFHTLADEAPLLVWETDENLQTVYLNLQGRRFFGYEAEESLAGLSWKKFIHPEDLDRVLEIMGRARVSRQSYSLEMRLKSGSESGYRWFLDNGAPRFKDGRFLGFIGTSLDINDRKEAEQELDGRVRQRTQELDQQNRLMQKQNDLIKKILESSLDHIAIYDREMRVLMINQSSLDLLGVREEEILGKKITDIVPQMTGGKGHQDLLKALAGQTIHNKIYHSPVTGRYYENFLAPLEDNNDQVYAALVVSHDITDLVHSTERLKLKNEELELSKDLLQQKNLELQASVDQLRSQEIRDEQKNNFIAMASHELKTPITSIKGYVQLLLDAFSKGNEEKGLPPLQVRSSLVSVDKQVARLTRLIAELLDLSKIETGTLELKKERFSLNELAIETVEDILYTNPAHTINLYHDHHAYVLADKDRIGQVMINFLTNAIKYSPGGSRIEVTIHKVAGGDIAFSVKDEGIGIAREDQEKIFERFYRAGGREEQTYPGFGIGLFIASEFIQKHGGTMFVKSEKGKGAVFTFSLPVNLS